MERYESERLPLIVMVAAPMVWAAHFIIVYAVAGTACQKLPALKALTLGQWSTLIATLVALLLIAWMAWRIAPRLKRDATSRFLTRVTLMLSVLSAVAVIFSGLPALLSPGCQ